MQNTKFKNSFLFFEKYVPLKDKLAALSNEATKIIKKPITNIDQHSQLKLQLRSEVSILI